MRAWGKSLDPAWKRLLDFAAETRADPRALIVAVETPSMHLRYHAELRDGRLLLRGPTPRACRCRMGEVPVAGEIGRDGLAYDPGRMLARGRVACFYWRCDGCDPGPILRRDAVLP